MRNLNELFISDAVAATGAPAQGKPDVLDFNAGGVWSDFLFHDPLRPQQKRTKAQKADGLHCER